MEVIGIGLFALGFFGAAIGVGNIFSALINGVSRNPSAEKSMFKSAMIGAAMAEAMGLLAMVLAILLFGKVFPA